jgi:adenylate kinase family enzyme
MTPQTIVFIGRSGCGKGTQVELLKNLLKEKDPSSEILYLETGAKFREFIAGQNYSNKLSKEIYENGGLQPEFLAIRNWSDMLIENVKGNEHIVFDGICRRLLETEVFTSTMDFYQRHPTVIYINVSRKWSTDRLSARGRFDDDADGIKKRLDWFDENTIPSVEHMKSNSKYVFLDINGEQTIEEVHKEIVQKLEW